MRPSRVIFIVWAALPLFNGAAVSADPPAAEEDPDAPRELTAQEKSFVDGVAQKGAKADQKDVDKSLALLNLAVQFDSRPTKGADAKEKALRIRNLLGWIKTLDAIDPLPGPNPRRAIFTADQGIVTLKTPVPEIPDQPVVTAPVPGANPPTLKTPPPPPPDDVPPPPTDKTFKSGTVLSEGADGQWQRDATAAPAGEHAEPVQKPAYDMSRANASLATASGMAGRMNAALRRPEELPPGASRAADARGARSASPDAAQPNVAEPRSAQEFLLAATPYKAAFDALGLKPGGPSGVEKKDGSPASGRDLDELRARIRAEPLALQRDPAYLDPDRGGVSREDFGTLKDAFRRDGGLRATEFRHVELVPSGEERDFKRSESCQLVSGNCNPHARKSYAKGEDVPAGDLKRILAAIRGHLGAARERGRTDDANARVSGIAARIGSFLRRYSPFRASAGPDGEAVEGDTLARGGSVSSVDAAAGRVGTLPVGSPPPAPAAGRFGGAGRAVESGFGFFGAVLLAAAAFVTLRRRS